MSQLAELRQRLQHLRQQAKELDQKPLPGKPLDWFDSDLFSCHSPYLTDYVDAAILHLDQLTHAAIQLSPAHQRHVVERIAAQCNALTRGFTNIQTRARFKPNHFRAKPVVQAITRSSRELYQQLSEYKEYEQRLEDMVRLAQTEANAVQKTLALQVRLGRCRRAITDVEQHIQQLEQGKRS